MVPCVGVVQTLAALPDQDSFYDVTDCLEQQGMESIIQQHMTNKATDLDLKQQLVIYEVMHLPPWREGAGYKEEASRKSRQLPHYTLST